MACSPGLNTKEAAKNKVERKCLAAKSLAAGEK
jgi:hypothetical protein